MTTRLVLRTLSHQLLRQLVGLTAGGVDGRIPCDTLRLLLNLFSGLTPVPLLSLLLRLRFLLQLIQVGIRILRHGDIFLEDLLQMEGTPVGNDADTDIEGDEVHDKVGIDISQHGTNEDQSDQDGALKIRKGHQYGVPDGILYGIHKLTLDGKNIHEGNEPQYPHKDTDRPCDVGKGKVAVIPEDHSADHRRSHQGIDQPDNGRLFEVDLKGMEEILGRITVIISQLHTAVDQCGGRRSDGNHRQGTNQPEDIQIPDPSDKNEHSPYRIIG